VLDTGIWLGKAEREETVLVPDPESVKRFEIRRFLLLLLLLVPSFFILFVIILSSN
jgi:hypothetical protein